MKKTAFFAAAAALAAASPAAANGFLGIEYGSSEIDSAGPSVDLDVWAGEGAFGFGGAGWGGQIDGSFGNADAGSGGDVDFYTLGGHLWWAGSGWRFGGVITTTSADAVGGTDIDEIAYGVEGAWDFNPNAGLVSSLTVGEMEQGSADIDTFNWDVGINFFASPSIRLGAYAGLGNLDGAADVDTTSFGLNGEFQPWAMPISITLGLNTFEVDNPVDVENTTFSVGARWNFGGGTLQDRHNAAPFDTNTGFANRLYGIW